MAINKSILIGCGETGILPVMLMNINDDADFRYKLITATNHTDLNSLVLSVKPDLLILCFRDNGQVLGGLCSFIREQQVPVICLTHNHKTPAMSDRHIVFSFPLEQLRQRNYLSSMVGSLLRLKAGTTPKPVTLADTAIRHANANDAGDLSRYVMELEQKKAVLKKVKDRIAELYPHVDNPVRTELNSIVSSIKHSVNDNKLWDDFKLYFEQNNPNFLLQLAEKHPELTPIDLKYCCYLKMNMSNDDIRNLLGINQESVRTHKYRLKKKMSLSPEEDLRAYLNMVDKNS